MEGISLDTASNFPSLSDVLYQELRSTVRGDAYRRGDPSFLDYSRMFNGDVEVSAMAVVCPLDAPDVSQVILFCRKHSISASVKAGGYGTAGWAVGGDIIIDLCKIVDIDIEPPAADGSFTSIRDMPLLGSKGKVKAGPLLLDRSATMASSKRRREDDDELRSYDLASATVADFLYPGGSSAPFADRPPVTRRRLEFAAPAVRTPQMSTYSATSGSRHDPNATLLSSNSSGSSIAMVSNPLAFNLPSTDGATTAVAPPYPLPDTSSNPPPCLSSLDDPFSYLDDTPNNPVPPVASTSRLAQSMPNALFATPSFLEAQTSILTYAMPIYSHAFMTFGAGKRQKEIDQFSAANPLEAMSLAGGRSVVPYHVPSAAHPVGSAIMILGGFGFLGRLHGLSSDNLVEAEVVLADGQIVVVSHNEHPDLWWALRGGGPAFGIVTRYKARAYPVPVVFAGNLIYRFHSATAPSLIKHFRDCVKGAPRELYANVLLTAGPAGQDSLVVIQMCYVGPKIKGQEFLQAISSWDGGRCLLNEVDEKSFLHQQDSVAQVLRGKAGNKWFIRSALISSLPDDIVNKTVLQFAGTPVGCTWLFELAGGALGDFEDNCIPKAQRQASFTVAALHQWDIGFQDPRCVHSAEEWIAETLAPVTLGGPLPSVCVSSVPTSDFFHLHRRQFLGRQEPPGRVIACYGENWARLCEVKKKYDPDNFFRNSFWPLNAQGEIIEPEEHEPQHIQF
ncbi:uncharacterized protein BJ212DRAFT_530909 [Suillus subaureus]|uniref:FAD-binding PCMH-type domain-containing protein n=1 Tax=Suillus subaureus TaxID=48587 RepID=A0A9P7EKT9_9AGAM|nr:uncharacterized protein BJ212DRAFT_530909 [Suillus subaureus]KAG1824494.1 hypothetical protein BJ212DRAFT_530909 [Suillus subaureus]